MLEEYKGIIKKFKYDYNLLSQPDCQTKIIQYFADIYLTSGKDKEFWLSSHNPIPAMIASNPNTPSWILGKLVVKERLISLVLDNPITSLLILENSNLMSEWLKSKSLIFLAQQHDKNLPINSNPEQIICLDEIKDFVAIEGFVNKGGRVNIVNTQHLIVKYPDKKSRIDVEFNFRKDNYKEKFSTITIRLYTLIKHVNTHKHKYKLDRWTVIPMSVNWRQNIRFLTKDWLNFVRTHQAFLPGILEFQESAY